MSVYPRINPLGDGAFLVELGEVFDLTLNDRVHQLAHTIEQFPGVVAVVPGYASLLVEYELPLLPSQALLLSIESAIRKEQALTPKDPSHIIEIPTHYGGEFGPDLEFVAHHDNLTTRQVIEFHTLTTYQVFMIGFAPGFPYLGILPEEIAAPRLETPRKSVPAGSVGIAGRQTGIYPRNSPGGWRLIGRTDVKLFDALQDPPILLSPGDQVRFVAV